MNNEGNRSRALVVPIRPGEMLTVERARDMLAKARRVDEVKRIRDQASAMRAYLRQQKAGVAAQNDAAEIVVWSRIRLGEMSKPLPKLPPKVSGALAGGRGKGGTSKAKAPPSKKSFLTAVGISEKEAAENEKLAAQPKKKIEAHIAAVRAGGERITMGGVLAATHVTQNSGNNEWYTPAPILEAAREVLGKIDLDPASSAAANKMVRARRFYAAKEDGLKQKWSGAVWMNPPYAQPLVDQFCAKLVDEYEAGNIDAAVVLVNNGTETAWGQRLLAACAGVCFPASRIRFVDANGKPGGAPLQGQMVIYLGESPRKFAAAFAAFGVCR